MLLVESETRTIPAEVVGFAIASTYAELCLVFGKKFDFMGHQNSAIVDITIPDNLSQEEVLESLVTGWSLTVSKELQGANWPDKWSTPSTLIEFLGHLPTEEATSSNELVPLDLYDFNPGSFVMPSSREPHKDTSYNWCQVVHSSALAMHLDLRKIGVALASDWSEATAAREQTRSVERIPLMGLINALAKSRHTPLLPSRRQWFAATMEQLAKLRDLQPDWNGYGAEDPQGQAFDAACKVMEVLNAVDLEPSRIVPSAAGGISVCFFRPLKYAEIECYNTGEGVAIIKNTRTNWRDIWEVSTITESIQKIQDFLEG